MLDQNFQSYQKHFTNKTRTDRRKSLFENDFTTPFSRQALKFDKKIGNHRIRNQISPITASLLSDISAERGREKKKNAFHRDFHLPDWLDGVERETELALKRRIVRGQSTEDVERKKGKPLAPRVADHSTSGEGGGC